MKFDKNIIKKGLEYRFHTEFEHICYDDIVIRNYKGYGEAFKVVGRTALGGAVWILPVNEYQKLNRIEKLKNLNKCIKLVIQEEQQEQI
jgi:hypothetical protein